MKWSKVVLLILGFGLLTVLAWWWQWQAPYRTLISFLEALERGDIDTLYSLAPPKERKLKIVTPELISYTYQQLLRPLLLEQYQLIDIRRASLSGSRPEIWIRDVAVVFYLYYRNKSDGKEINPPLVVFVSRPLGEKKWYIPFSYYVFTTAHSLIGFDETQGDAWMCRAGYRFVYLHNGGIVPLKPIYK